MSNKEEWIQKFLSQELRGGELSTFKELMETDPRFASEVQEQAEMIVALQAAEALQQADRLDSSEQKVIPLQPSFPIKRYLLVASISLLVLSMLWLNFSGPSIKEIAEEQVEDRRVKSLLYTSRNDQASEAKGIDSYILQYEDLSSQEPDNATLKFMIGDLYLHQGQVEQAIEAYETAITIDPSDELGKWNLALAYIRSGDNDSGISILKALQATGSPAYQEKAGRLSDQLHSSTFRRNLGRILGK